MSAVTTPPIPARLADRPTAGGLVIPWFVVTLADGSPDWRACVRHRVNAAITNKLCSLDGQPIVGSAVFFVGGDQLAAEPGGPIVTDVPPVHPECAAYSAKSCPMLGGRMRAYADRPTRCATSRQNRCTDPGCGCGGWVSVDGRRMAGQPAGQWYGVWADRWAVSPASDGALFAVIARPRRIRPVSGEH